MTADLKAKWIAALRSGAYKKATGQLTKDGRSYCCLGVLCVVAGREVLSNPGALFAPDDLLPHGMQSQLANRNDGIEYQGFPVPWSFAELADWIDANVPVDTEPES